VLRLKRLFKPKVSRIALLHFGRAGSTLIASLIQQNKGFFYDGELFEKVRVGQIKIPEDMRLDPSLLLKKRSELLFKKYLVSLKPIPEEHLRTDLLNSDYQTLIDKLVTYGFDRFIILKRENYLNQMISLALAREWGKYHFTQGEKPARVCVDIPFTEFRFGTFKGELIELFERFDNYYKEFELLTPDPLVINYEGEIEKDPLVAYGRVAEYLGLHKMSPKITLRKSNVFENKDVIENYPELIEYLANSKYAWMI